MTPQRLVAVLSGGGAKAAGHVGALRALEECGLTPAHYVGTSMGAVVGACFAAGLSYDEVVRRVTVLQRHDVASPSPSLLAGPLARSLLRASPLRETIESLVPARRFGELRTPLTVTAVDADNGQLVLFGAGGREGVPLVEALYASCALPLYYPPAEIGGRLYVDGGLRSVLPLDVAATFEPDLLFAVDIGPSLAAPPPGEGRGLPLLRAHSGALRILMAAQTEATVERWRDAPVPTVLVRPPTVQQSTFDVEHAVRYVEDGYRAARRALDDWCGER